MEAAGTELTSGWFDTGTDEIWRRRRAAAPAGEFVQPDNLPQTWAAMISLAAARSAARGIAPHGSSNVKFCKIEPKFDP